VSTSIKSTALNPDHVCPDGVVFAINWGKFEVGMSLFIPAIDMINLNKQMQIIARRYGITLDGMQRIENGYLGMRFWRIL